MTRRRAKGEMVEGSGEGRRRRGSEGVRVGRRVVNEVWNMKRRRVWSKAVRVGEERRVWTVRQGRRGGGRQEQNKQLKSEEYIMWHIYMYM